MTLVNAVKVIIDEPNTSKFWPITQVYDAINEAAVDLIGQSQIAITTSTITATTSSKYVQLPVDIMIPKFVLDTANREIPKINYATLERESPNWGTETSTQLVGFVEFDYNTLQLYPIVTVPTELRIVGVAYPTEVTTGTEDFSANTAMNNAAKFWAGAILMDASRPDLSEAFMHEGQNNLNDVMREFRNNQSHSITRLSPASRIDSRRSGDMGVIRGYR